MNLRRDFRAAKGMRPFAMKEGYVFKKVMVLAVGLSLAITGFIPLQGAQAALRPRVIEVQNDPGGELAVRVEEIQRLRASGSQVRIVSGYCNSACTMYLGLPNTCVNRNVSFGFHGPMSQFYGMALPPDDFEYWSGVMASYYPGAIRAWFLSEARYTTVGLIKVSGRELIGLGVRECQ